MSGQTLFRRTILVGTAACFLGLGACTMMNEREDEWLSEDPEFEALSIDGAASPENDIIPCRSDEEDCAVSDDYLTNTFVQTEFVTEENKPTDMPLFTENVSEDVIALSRPAGANAVSVKDKAVSAKQSTEDRVLYSTVAAPETTQKTVREIEKSKTVTPAATVAVTETEQVKKVEQGVEVENDLQTAISVPGQMMPLKKVTTTITETTTKIKQEPKDKTKKEYNFKKMSLKEKVAYGEEEQEWQANSGNTLRGLLMDWGNKSGWTVVWKLDRDYRLEAGVVFQGTFTDVSSALIRSFARATPAPIGTFYQGNRVLVISTQEDENER